MNNLKTKQTGFTLIELLVVISIIGVLTTLITSNLATAQSRARDARRKTDLKVIAQGLEMYYSQNNSYPAVGNGSSGTFDFATNTLVDANGADVYIKAMPKDPRNVAVAASSTYFEYYYCTSAAGATPRRVFNLYANLENNADPDRLCGSGSTATDFTAAGAAASCDADAASTCSEGSSVTTAGTSTNTLGNVRTRSDFTVSDP